MCLDFYSGPVKIFRPHGERQMFLSKMSSRVLLGEDWVVLGNRAPASLQCEMEGPLENDYLMLKLVGAQR